MVSTAAQAATWRPAKQLSRMLSADEPATQLQEAQGASAEGVQQVSAATPCQQSASLASGIHMTGCSRCATHARTLPSIITRATRTLPSVRPSARGSGTAVGGYQKFSIGMQLVIWCAVCSRSAERACASATPKAGRTTLDARFSCALHLRGAMASTMQRYNLQVMCRAAAACWIGAAVAAAVAAGAAAGAGAFQSSGLCGRAEAACRRWPPVLNVQPSA